VSAARWRHELICPDCDAGVLWYRTDTRGTCILLCDECDACFLDPTDVRPGSAVYLSSPDSQLRSPFAWATHAEVSANGWEKDAFGG
jgi:hypothetical protein